MKKLLTKMLAASILFVGANSLVSTALAEESEVKINFTSPTEDNTNPVEPLDPKDPNQKKEPQNGKKTGKKGGLTLDVVPNFDFGTHSVIPTKSKTYEAVSDEPYAQVSDRRGTGAGWKLTAKMEDFENVTLKGSTLTLKDGLAKTSTDNDHITGPSVSANITLQGGGQAVTIATANARTQNQPANTAQGLGTWLITWLKGDSEDKNSKATLTLPNGGEVGEHTTKIVWTLSNSPQ